MVERQNTNIGKQVFLTAENLLQHHNADKTQAVHWVSANFGFG